jgi:hypothetical protein
LKNRIAAKRRKKPCAGNRNQRKGTTDGRYGTDKTIDSREKVPIREIREIRGKTVAKMDATFVLHCVNKRVFARLAHFRGCLIVFHPAAFSV